MSVSNAGNGANRRVGRSGRYASQPRKASTANKIPRTYQGSSNARERKV